MTPKKFYFEILRSFKTALRPIWAAVSPKKLPIIDTQLIMRLTIIRTDCIYDNNSEKKYLKPCPGLQTDTKSMIFILANSKKGG